MREGSGFLCAATEIMHKETKMPDAGFTLRHLAFLLLTSDLQLPQHFQKIFVVRLIGNVVDVYVDELAFLVHDENCAL